MQGVIRTLAEYIEDVALRTGAPSDFIEKVGFIFSSKGIALSENAGPYASLVEETFLLDETLRMNEKRALVGLDRIAQEFEFARGYLGRQVEKLAGIQETMEGIVRKNATRDETAPSCDSLVSAARAGNVYIFPGPRNSH